MAIFYMNVQIIGRSAGRAATGAAAYRAGARIVDERTGQVFDYTRRRGELESAIVAPPGSPSWVQDRAQLWNAVEKAERRSDAQVAREIVVAFPKELGKEQQRELIAGYVQEQFVARGMVADVAIHRNPGNPHAHIMLTMRELGPDGLSNKKNRDGTSPNCWSSGGSGGRAMPTKRWSEQRERSASTTGVWPNRAQIGSRRSIWGRMGPLWTGGVSRPRRATTTGLWPSITPWWWIWRRPERSESGWRPKG